MKILILFINHNILLLQHMALQGRAVQETIQFKASSIGNRRVGTGGGGGGGESDTAIYIKTGNCTTKATNIQARKSVCLRLGSTSFPEVGVQSSVLCGLSPILCGIQNIMLLATLRYYLF